MTVTTESMEKITLALDWTPNTIHSGFYVAKANGWYKDAGLDVTLLSPHSDAYATTPAQRVASGEADLAIAPAETVVSSHTQPAGSTKPKLTAVAAVLQKDTSAIVTLSSSGLDRPAKLDGKVYASYGARYEGRIVQRMIQNDGGKGDYEEQTPPMLGIWDTLLQGKADATWIFSGWEGVEARRQGVELNYFNLADHGISYGYAPVLVARADTLSEKTALYKKFLEASARGWVFAAERPSAAAELLTRLAAAENKDLPKALDAEMVLESQNFIAPSILPASKRWGVMDAERWSKFLDWLSESGLLTSKVQSRDGVGSAASLDALRAGDVGELISRDSIDAQSLFTNDLLP